MIRRGFLSRLFGFSAVAAAGRAQTQTPAPVIFVGLVEWADKVLTE
jgi:hypothetical protein